MYMYMCDISCSGLYTKHARTDPVALRPFAGLTPLSPRSIARAPMVPCGCVLMVHSHLSPEATLMHGHVILACERTALTQETSLSIDRQTVCAAETSWPADKADISRYIALSAGLISYWMSSAPKIAYRRYYLDISISISILMSGSMYCGLAEDMAYAAQ